MSGYWNSRKFCKWRTSRRYPPYPVENTCSYNYKRVRKSLQYTSFISVIWGGGCLNFGDEVGMLFLFHCSCLGILSSSYFYLVLFSYCSPVSMPNPGIELTPTMSLNSQTNAFTHEVWFILRHINLNRLFNANKIFRIGSYE